MPQHQILKRQLLDFGFERTLEALNTLFKKNRVWTLSHAKSQNGAIQMEVSYHRVSRIDIPTRGIFDGRHLLFYNSEDEPFLDVEIHICSQGSNPLIQTWVSTTETQLIIESQRGNDKKSTRIYILSRAP